MVKILAIDINKDILSSLNAFISNTFPESTLDAAYDESKGIKIATAKDPDVILLDLDRSDLDVYEISRRLKQKVYVRDIPLVFLSAVNVDGASRMKALESGAEAFLSKPVDEFELTALIRAMIKIKAANRQKQSAHAEPEGVIGSMELSDILDADLLQSILEDFYQLTGILGAILDLSGKVLVAVGWQDICTKFHRCHPDTLKNCIESDTLLTSGVPQGTFKAYRCKNHMWDIVTPLIVGGRHMGNVFMGQYFNEGEMPDMALFREQARKYGFDEEEYLAALSRVPHFSKETVEKGMTFYTRLAELISSLSYSAIQKSQLLAQRKHAESSLKESEINYSRLYNSIRDAILIADTNRNITGCNTAFTELFGYSIDEIKNKKTITVYENEEQFKELGKALEEHANDVTPFLYTVYYKKKNGEIFAGETSIYYLKRSDGTITGFMGLIRDISARIKTQKELLESEERLRLSTELADVAVWEVNLITKRMSRSENHDKLYGLDEQEKWQLSSFLNATHPEDKDLLNSIFQGSADLGGPDDYQLDFRVVYPDKSIHWLSLTGKVIERNSEGLGIIVRGCLIDITERKKAEAERIEIALELDRTSEQLDSFLDSVPDSFVLLDSHLNFLDVNKTGLKWWKKEKKDVIGKNLLELIPDSMESGRYDIYKNIILTGKPYASDEIAIYGIEDMYFSIRAFKVGGGVGIITTDISERKKVEKNLVDSERRYRELFENMNTGYVLFEAFLDDQDIPIDLLILAANREFAVTTGLKIPDVIGKRLTKVLPGIESDAAEWIDTYGKIAMTGESLHFEQGSELLGYFYNINAFQAGPKRCAVTFLDITERKVAEKEMTNKLEELRRWHSVMIEREERVLDLKREVNDLLVNSGEPVRYTSVESGESEKG